LQPHSSTKGIVGIQKKDILLSHLFCEAVYRIGGGVLDANFSQTGEAFYLVPSSHLIVAKWRLVSKLPFKDMKENVH